MIKVTDVLTNEVIDYAPDSEMTKFLADIFEAETEGEFPLPSKLTFEKGQYFILCGNCGSVTHGTAKDKWMFANEIYEQVKGENDEQLEPKQIYQEMTTLMTSACPGCLKDTEAKTVNIIGVLTNDAVNNLLGREYYTDLPEVPDSL